MIITDVVVDRLQGVIQLLPASRGMDDILAEMVTAKGVIETQLAGRVE